MSPLNPPPIMIKAECLKEMCRKVHELVRKVEWHSIRDGREENRKNFLSRLLPHFENNDHFQDFVRLAEYVLCHCPSTSLPTPKDRSSRAYIKCTTDLFIFIEFVRGFHKLVSSWTSSDTHTLLTVLYTLTFLFASWSLKHHCITHLGELHKMRFENFWPPRLFFCSQFTVNSEHMYPKF